MASRGPLMHTVLMLVVAVQMPMMPSGKRVLGKSAHAHDDTLQASDSLEAEVNDTTLSSGDGEEFCSAFWAYGRPCNYRFFPEMQTRPPPSLPNFFNMLRERFADTGMALSIQCPKTSGAKGKPNKVGGWGSAALYQYQAQVNEVNTKTGDIVTTPTGGQINGQFNYDEGHVRHMRPVKHKATNTFTTFTLPLGPFELDSSQTFLKELKLGDLEDTKVELEGPWPEKDTCPRWVTLSVSPKEWFKYEYQLEILSEANRHGIGH